ncbi:antichymotrypsin-2 [Helicoverpa armigera]|uniref:antichymotrypsin-2 n=1 Tax=Helicoverpa armigera TaxID=29058 RepID=UPI003083EA1E
MTTSSTVQIPSGQLAMLFVYISFLVSAKKHKQRGSIGSSEYREYDEAKKHLSTSEEEPPPPLGHDSFFEMRGSLRREFALQAALDNHGRNMICSPISAMMPLGKLVLGAKKTTEKELLSALGLTERKQISTAFRLLITNMEYLPGVTLDVASRIYVSSKADINKKFMKRTKKIFKSSCRKIDRSNPSRTARDINKWVAEKTKNKITELLSDNDITEDTSMVLVNAVYFAGAWSNPFDNTFTGDFHTPTGVRRMPKMSREGSYNYYKSDTLNAQVIEIPYKGDYCSMVIVLPYSNDGLPVLLRALKLAPELLNEALDRMKSTEVLLTMPKFKIESEFDLRDLYRKIGLRSMTDRSKSDLTGIVDDETIYVSKAIHKAVIEVNERGTEAAAATEVEVVFTSAILNLPIFDANRPFLFYITFVQEQLFAGVFSG